MAKKSFTKAAIGKEATLGTAATLTARVPITDLAVIGEEVSKSDSGIIIGRNSNSPLSLDSVALSASLPTQLMGNKSTVLLLESLFGVAADSIQIGAAMQILYKGASASCKLVIDASTIKSYIGTKGAETLDNTFGSSGTLTLSGTVASVMAAINGYDDYEAALLTGDSTAAATAAAITGTHQAKGHCVPIFIGSSTSGIYVTAFRPNYTEGENSTVSLQTEGTGKTEMAVGGAVDSVAISASLKSKVTAQWELKLTKWNTATLSETILKLDENDLDPMKFQGGKTIIGGKVYDYIKSVSVNLSNNIADDEGWSQGSLYKGKHFRGTFAVGGSISMTVDSDAETQRAKVASDDEVAIQLVYAGRDIGAGCKTMSIIDMPTCQYSGFSKSAGSSAVEMSLEFTCTDFNGYDDYASLYLVTSFQAIA